MSKSNQMFIEQCEKDSLDNYYDDSFYQYELEKEQEFEEQKEILNDIFRSWGKIFSSADTDKLNLK
tara:strand:- start:159 stop:356 length:198 start_codon:yes stop_codon:yes gene_type:complete